MNLSDYCRSLRNLVCLGLLGLVLGGLAQPVRAQNAAAKPPAAPAYQPTPAEFAALGQVVAQLLKDRDTGRFATNVTINAGDLRSILDPAVPADGEQLQELFANTVAEEQRKFAVSAQALLAQADALHVNLTNGDWQPRVVVPGGFGSIHFAGLQAEGQGLISAEGLDVVFHPHPGATNEEYKITLAVLMKFPGGWRAYEGAHWAAFPATVGDEQTRRVMTILNQAAAGQSITAQDDPALLKLGEALIRFLEERNVAIYQMDALVNPEFFWGLLQKSGQTGATRAEVAEKLKPSLAEQTERANTMLKQMDLAGVDLQDAHIQIRQAAVETAQAPMPGTLDGLTGHKFILAFTVKSGAKSKTGVSLAGDYEIAADSILRFGGDWRVTDNLYWYQFPPGVLNQSAIDSIRADNYIMENHLLPPGAEAPDIAFAALDGGRPMKLSDLRGKVVVLDFWASWCGPCQAPLAELQTLRNDHPAWKDKVIIVPLSIDDTAAKAFQHLAQRGWTNTFNVWGGGGVWDSPAAKAFLVQEIPTTYIIDAQGKIAASGHPQNLPIAQAVDELLKK